MLEEFGVIAMKRMTWIGLRNNNKIIGNNYFNFYSVILIGKAGFIKNIKGTSFAQDFSG